MNNIIIYNESGKVIGSQIRSVVHTAGYWHKGLQLNIYNKGKTLIQRRSVNCDIAWNLYDQSLATQMLESDAEDEYKALKRGLFDELGINLDLLSRPQKVAGPYEIMKTYDYTPGFVNNEFISLYRLDLEKMVKFKINHYKVNFVKWIDIDKFKDDIMLRPIKYTKTAYFWLTKGYI